MATFVRSEPHVGSTVEAGPGHNRAGPLVEALFAAGGITLAVIGLAGAAPRFLDTIADIALGVAFLSERWTITGRTHEGVFVGEAPSRGLTAEAVAGWTGVVLGILSLVRVAPTILAPIALLVFGAGLALGVGVGSKSGRILLGCGAIVLGILAIIGIDPRTLTLCGLIAVGSALLLSVPALGLRGPHHMPHPAT